MKVLLIDDDEDLMTIFTTAFTNEQFETIYELTGQAGIDRANKELPDVILLDQVLPDMAGNDVLKKLKADEATKNIPVILLSNFSQEDLVKNAIDLGAVDYVYKYQVEPKDVITKVREALKTKAYETAE